MPYNYLCYICKTKRNFRIHIQLFLHSLNHFFFMDHDNTTQKIQTQKGEVLVVSIWESHVNQKSSFKWQYIRRKQRERSRGKEKNRVDRVREPKQKDEIRCWPKKKQHYEHHDRSRLKNAYIFVWKKTKFYFEAIEKVDGLWWKRWCVHYSIWHCIQILG